MLIIQAPLLWIWGAGDPIGTGGLVDTAETNFLPVIAILRVYVLKNVSFILSTNAALFTSLPSKEFTILEI